jgi:hypothetical protein
MSLMRIWAICSIFRCGQASRQTTQGVVIGQIARRSISTFKGVQEESILGVLRSCYSFGIQKIFLLKSCLCLEPYCCQDAAQHHYAMQPQKGTNVQYMNIPGIEQRIYTVHDTVHCSRALPRIGLYTMYPA